MAGCKRISNRNLWQFISGTGILRPKELVALELKENSDMIVSGILYYKTSSSTSFGARLKKERKISEQQLDFLQKLSVFLNLDEVQCYDLFCSFLACEYRGSEKGLKQILNNDQHTKGLILKIRDYYLTERLYLLCCLKYIICNGQESSSHPYQDVYCGFVNSLNAGDILAKSLEDQLASCCEPSLPSWETHGTLMNKRQVLKWAHQNLKEQLLTQFLCARSTLRIPALEKLIQPECEVLETIVICLGDIVACSAERFSSLLEKFKKQGFGQRLSYHHILDESAEQHLRRLDYLEIILVLKCLDFDIIQSCMNEQSFKNHAFLNDPRNFKTLDKVFQSFSGNAAHGPLMLGWAVVRFIYLGQDDKITKKMGCQALQLNAIEYINNLLDLPHFSGNTVLGSVANFTVYCFLCTLLDAFQEETLGDLKILYSVTAKVLRKPGIANDMWKQGLTKGTGNLYQMAVNHFPLDFFSLVQLSSALASAGQDSARKVVSILQTLPVYTECFDQHSSTDLSTTRDPVLWQLARDRYPYSAEHFRIPQGIYGHLQQDQAKSGQTIQWEHTHNGWQLFACEIQELLFQVSRSPNMVTLHQISRTTQTICLIKEVLISDIGFVDQFEKLTGHCYQIIHRCAALQSPPLELLAACVECLTLVGRRYPLEVWQNIKQTGLLPYMTGNLDNTGEIFSGQGLQAGLYGTILAGFECPQGRYPLSLAFLEFISTLITELSKWKADNELTATVLFILREVFPSFYKWRYYMATRREAIGHKCLEIFHKILDIMSKPNITKLHSLQGMCVQNLLFTEAGQSLLNIMSIGVNAVEEALVEQGRSFEKGCTELIDLIHMSFSVLNRLLLLKPPDLPLSPVENTLSLPPASQQDQHIVLTVAQYIHHHHTPKLPTMAILLLKRLAVVSPMSILAILGNNAEPIRDKLLSRLAALTEDLQLKVAILELLCVCVVTQPGLIERFLNLKLLDSTTGEKELSLGSSSCLNTVLNLLIAEKQRTYQCPPNLLRACVEFIHALWTGMRETAMAVLRKNNFFWSSICAPLDRDIKESDDLQVQTCDIKTVAYIFRILAQEIYTVPSTKYNENFTKVISAISQGNRIKYWSKYIRETLKDASKEVMKEPNNLEISADILGENPTLKLLTAWKNWLVTIAKFKVPGLVLKDELKMRILSDLLEAIQVLSEGTSLYRMKLASIASALYFTVITSWVSSVNKWSALLNKQRSTLETSFSNDRLIPSVQIGLVGSVTVVLQHIRQDGITVDQSSVSALLPTVCSILLKCIKNSSPSVGEMSADCSPQQIVHESKKREVNLKLLTTTLLVLEEIVQNLKDPGLWLPPLHNHLIPAMLTSLEIWIKAKQGPLFVKSMLTLLLTVSKSEQGANTLKTGEFAEHVCLPLMSLYSSEDLPPKMLPTTREKGVTDAQSWHDVLCLSIDLYSSLLTTLRYSFLKETLDFVGVHQDRLLQSMDFAKINLTEAALKEACATCGFILQLSYYVQDWKFHLPKVLNKIMTSMVYMCQMFISLLVRPRYLQHVLEHQMGMDGLSKTKRELILVPIPSLLQQATVEDFEQQPSARCWQVQRNILSILALCLSALRQFTPHLYEILIDQSMDVSQYNPFISIGFNTPSMDENTAPTFGTLLACINMCMLVLPKVTPRGNSPQKATDVGNVISKNLVMFVLENSLFILMSQAIRYLKEPSLSVREKQLLKRELGAELNSFLMALHRHLRKGGPVSPSSSTLNVSQSAPPGGSPLVTRSISQTGFTNSPEQAFFKLVLEFVMKVLQ